MKIKKGFTLVEIILSIGLIVVIGTISLVSFNLIKKHSKTNTLENMSDEILRAVNVYVETNSGVKDELYENKNGLVIPLTTLENSGLIDFNGLNLDDEEDYVVTMLGSTEEGVDYCAETYTAKSWSIKDEVVYICEKNDGTKNLVTVAGEADNLSKSARERYYFREYEVFNYVQLKGDTSKTYQILYIDKDDSLVLVSDSSFGSTFSGATQSQTCYGTNAVSGFCNVNDDKLYGTTNGTVNSSECKIGGADVLNSSVCLMSYGYESYTSGSWQTKSGGTGNNPTYNMAYATYSWAVMTDNYNVLGWLGTNVSVTNSNKVSITPPSKYKIHLKSCMKITSGTGDMATPYIIERVNCS